MPSVSVSKNKPFRFFRAGLLGIGLSSLLYLFACSTETREFTSSGGGNGPGAGGPGGTGGNDAGSGPGGNPGPGGSGGNPGPGGSGGNNPCGNSDPDCKCDGPNVVARDEDDDGAGTAKCGAAPGDDCDDGDDTFVRNECGGCDPNIGGTVGGACGDCGFFECQGEDGLRCAGPNPAPVQCAGNVPQVCSTNGQWVNQAPCSGGTPLCLAGSCVQCSPGATRCTSIASPDDAYQTCLGNGFWETSWTSCGTSSQCSDSSGQCVQLFHPRDRDFQVPKLLQEAPGAPAAPGVPTRDVLDLATGIAFA